MRLVTSAIVLFGVLLSCSGTDAIILTQLTSGGYDKGDPCFSPDGNQIVFTENWRGLYLISPTGGPATLLLPYFGYQLTWPTWSPDGNTIVFMVDYSEQHIWTQQIWSIPSAGGAAVQLTHSNGWKRHPSWSPTGTDIAFAWETDGKAVYDIWSMPASGGDSILIAGVPEFQEMDPNFSPSGAQIAFSSNATGSFEIYVKFVNGGPAMQLTTLTAEGGACVEPAWSPDGNWIAFSGPDPAGSAIWVISAAGGVPICLTCADHLNYPDTEIEDGTPNWSPDGRSIVFDRYPGWNNKTDVWIATDLNLGPTAINQTTWGRIKTMFR